MARAINEGFDGTAGGGKAAQVMHADGRQSIALPDESFIRDARIEQDGQDLVLTAPDGSVIVIEGYFAAEPAPVLTCAEGTALTPQLVESFVHHAAQYASTGSATDESPVGTVQEVSGRATVTRADGTIEPIAIGTPIYQGDVVETDCGDCAVNIRFIDESSVIVSENARLAIDEYVFDPSSEAGSTDISILRGLFVFTSGLIGREDPDDVSISTPHGSIGIRGTIIAGNADTGEITVLEGAIVLRTFEGAEMTLSERFETARFDTANGEIVSMGRMDSNAFVSNYEPVRSVSPQLFSGIETDGAPGADPDPAPGDAPAPQDAAPEQQQAPADQPANAPQPGEGSGASALPPVMPATTQTMIVSGTSFDGGQTAGFNLALDPRPAAMPPLRDMAGPAPAGATAQPLPTADTAIRPPAPALTADQPPPPPVTQTNTNGGTAGSGGTTTVAPVIVNLSDLGAASANGFFTVGHNGNSEFGSSIAALGDVNGDGFADIGFVMGSSAYAPAGVSFTLLGAAGNYSNGTASAFISGGKMTTQGLAFTGAADEMNIAHIGDLRGNGGNYYIVSTPNADSGTAGSGQAKIYDSAGTQIAQLAGLVAGDRAGESVAGIGDINGDGRQDVIIGAPFGDSGDGEAYIILGQNTMPANIDVSSAFPGFKIMGISSFGELGRDVSAAGDFNSDGYDDFIISVGGSNEAHIVFGNAGISGATLTTGGTVYDTMRIFGIGVDAQKNMPLFSMGDMDGDGINDIAIATTAPGAQAMHFFFGSESRGAGNVSLGAADFKIVKSGGDARVLSGGGAAGDFNGDGLDDAVVIMTNGTAADIYVVYGKDGMSGTMFSNDLNSAGNAFRMTYDMTGHITAEFNVSRAGDINGDGFEDITVTMPGRDLNSDGTADGAAFVIYGRETSVADVTRVAASGTATAGGQHLVGGAGINVMNDGGHNDLTMRGGAGDDVFQLTNANFNHIDGGTGWDTLQFMQPPGSTIDLTSFSEKEIQGIEKLMMAATGSQHLVLSLDNIFSLMKESEHQKLYIDANGNTGNTLEIDAGTPDPLATRGDLEALFNAPGSPVTPVGGYYEFQMAGKTVAIDAVLIDNNNVTVS